MPEPKDLPFVVSARDLALYRIILRAISLIKSPNIRALIASQIILRGFRWADPTDTSDAKGRRRMNSYQNLVDDAFDKNLEIYRPDID